MVDCCRWACMCVVVCSILSSAATIEQVSARKERCAVRLERAEERIDEARRIYEGIAHTDPAAAATAAARLEHLRSRADNAWSRLDGIESQLSQVVGGCPECIAKSVDLFCRQAENLDADAGALARDLRQAGYDVSTARPQDDSSAGSIGVGQQQPANAWRVTIGGDYSHVGDISRRDTATTEGADSILALTENPLSGYLAARWDYRRNGSWLARISPSLYVSNLRASAGVESQMMPGEHVEVTLEAEGAKRLTRRIHDAGDDPLEWVGGGADDLDRLSGEARVAYAQGARGESLRFGLPVCVGGQGYRNHMRGYSSYVRYAGTPWVEAAAGEGDVRARVDMRLEYRDYFANEGFVPGAGVDSLDVLKLEPSVECEATGDHLQGRLVGTYQHHRFVDRRSPSVRRRGDAVLSGRVTGGRRLSADGRIGYEYFGEEHDAVAVVQYDTTVMTFLGPELRTMYDTVGVEYTLGGHSWEGRLEGRVALVDGFQAGVYAEYEAGVYSFVDQARGREMSAPAYLDEDHHEIAPGGVVSVSLPFLEATLSGAYRYETVADRGFYEGGDNRGWEASMDISLRVLDRVSVLCAGEVERRYYLNKEHRETVNGYLSVSAALTL